MYERGNYHNRDIGSVGIQMREAETQHDNEQSTCETPDENTQTPAALTYKMKKLQW